MLIPKQALGGPLTRLEARLCAPHPLRLLLREWGIGVLSPVITAERAYIIDEGHAIHVGGGIAGRVEVKLVVGVPLVGQRNVLVVTSQVREVVIDTIAEADVAIEADIADFLILAVVVQQGKHRQQAQRPKEESYHSIEST
jgi:hypothetical protein